MFLSKYPPPNARCLTIDSQRFYLFTPLSVTRTNEGDNFSSYLRNHAASFDVLFLAKYMLSSVRYLTFDQQQKRPGEGRGRIIGINIFSRKKRLPVQLLTVSVYKMPMCPTKSLQFYAQLHPDKVRVIKSF